MPGVSPADVCYREERKREVSAQREQAAVSETTWEELEREIFTEEEIAESDRRVAEIIQALSDRDNK